MQASSSNGAIRWGIIFGVILAVVNILANVIVHAAFGGTLANGDAQQITGVAGGLLAVGCGGLLIELALVFVAGIFAARDSGSVGQGAIGGLIAGAVGAVIGGIAGIVIDSISPITLRTTAGTPSTIATGVGISIAGTIFSIILWAGLGAGLGALGGLIGKAQYRGPTAAYQGSMYQGMSQPQGYPPAPGYPQQPQGYPPQYPQQPQGYPQQPQQGYPPQQPQQDYPQNPGEYPPPPPPQYPPQQ